MAAYELRRHGYPVTLFEAEAFLGGALRLYIPPYRLPREVLEREVSVVSQLGTEVKLRTRLGRDVHLEDLRRDFAAVFLALGAHKSLRLQIPGENLAGVEDGISFLKAVNAGTPLEVGRRVAVIGGGNAAVDAARSAWRGGAREVHLLYRRTLDLMPALASEVEEARREGVQFHFLTLPVRLLGDGRVRKLVAQKTTLGEPDAGGRSCPAPVAGSEFSLEVDTVILAVGQTADFSFFGPGLAFDTATILPAGGGPGDPEDPDPRGLCRGRPGYRAPERGGGLCRRPPGRPGHPLRPARAAAARKSCRPWPAGPPTSLWIPRGPSYLPSAHARPEPGGTNGPTGRRSGAGVQPPQPPGPKPPAASPAPVPNASRTAPFSRTMSQQFPGTEKELVRLLAERGLSDPLVPYSCHYCGLCQTVCPQDLHVGQACLAAREALVAQGEGPLPPHKGIQNYVKWGASPTFALSRPGPGHRQGGPGLFPGLLPGGPRHWGGEGSLRPPAPEVAGYGHYAQLLRRPQLFHRGKRRHAPHHRERGRGTEEAGRPGNHRGLHPLLPDPEGISPGVQNPHDLRGAERSGSTGGSQRQATVDLQHPGRLRRPPGAPKSMRRCAAW